MRLKRLALAAFGKSVTGTLALAGRRYRDVARAALSKRLVPLVSAELPGAGAIRFLCPSEMAVQRARTVTTREPDTIAWIDGFERGSVLWDIGANVGVYSLYAARVRDARVVAFEPAAANFFLLTHNIALNGLNARIMPLCIPLGATTGLGVLSLSDGDFAAALHSFESRPSPAIEASGTDRGQIAPGFSIDDFADRFAPPSAESCEDRRRRHRGRDHRRRRWRLLAVRAEIGARGNRQRRCGGISGRDRRAPGVRP